MIDINYLRLLRIPAVFTAVSNIIAAHTLASMGNMHWDILVVSVLASACLYHSGMVFNDIFDYSTDQRERANRPLPSGAVSLRNAWTLAVSLMVAGLLAAASLGFVTFLIALALCVFIMIYNGPAKPHMFAPVFMALCRGFNWLLGLAAVGLVFNNALFALPVFLYTLGLSMLGRSEANPQSRVPLIVCGVLVFLVGVMILWLSQAKSGYLPVTSGIMAFIFLLVFHRFWIVYRLFNADTVQRLVSYLILGMIPLDALILVSQGYYITAGCLLFLVIPGRWAAGRIAIT